MCVERVDRVDILYENKHFSISFFQHLKQSLRSCGIIQRDRLPGGGVDVPASHLKQLRHEYPFIKGGNVSLLEGMEGFFIESFIDFACSVVNGHSMVL